MKSYLTSEGIPIKTNTPQLGYTELTKKEYEIKIKEKNDKVKADEEALEASMAEIYAQDKRIQAKLREIALKDLKEDDLRINLNVKDNIK